jgi:ATP-dependent Clp protease ATP-binding subunit ClpA
MFERFTKEARTAVVDAQRVARDAGSRSVDTRHLLVALLEAPGPVPRAFREVGADADAVAASLRDDLRAGGLDADALASLGIDLDAVRRRTDAVFGPQALDRAGRTPRGHVPFTPDAKKALELALREALRLGHRGIRSSHLLLGILRAESPGRTHLAHEGVDGDALRRVVEEQTRAA